MNLDDLYFARLNEFKGQFLNNSYIQKTIIQITFNKF